MVIPIVMTSAAAVMRTKASSSSVKSKLRKKQPHNRVSLKTPMKHAPMVSIMTIMATPIATTLAARVMMRSPSVAVVVRPR